jgi:hypothetical protein
MPGSCSVMTLASGHAEKTVWSAIEKVSRNCATRRACQIGAARPTVCAVNSLGVSSWFAALALMLGAQTASAFAQAPGARAALVNPGAELERAARVALEPWHVKLVILTAPTPGATAPRANQAARALARAEDCDAVVWISEHERGHALWIYDRAADHAVALTLATPPPFDGPTAAAVALSIKTLLRHSTTAPPRERFGAVAQAAEPAPQALREPAPPHVPLADEVGVRAGSEPQASRAPVGRARAVEQNGQADPTIRAPTQDVGPSLLDVEAAAAVRAHFAVGRGPEARFGGGMSWWPRARWAGVSLRAASGPAMTVSTDVFRGRLRDTSIILAARVRHDVHAKLRLFGAAGAGVEVTVLRGNAASSQAESVVRFNPSLAAELGMDWLIASWFKAGVQAGVAWLPLTQRYLIQGEPTLTLSSWTVEGALVLAVCLPN